MIIKFIVDDLQITWRNDDKDEPEISMLALDQVDVFGSQWASQPLNTLENVIKVIRYINENNMFPTEE